MKEQNSRKLREDLRKRGEKVSDHMKYSWEEDKGGSTRYNLIVLYHLIK